MGKLKRQFMEQMTREDAEELIKKQGQHKECSWRDCCYIEEWSAIKEIWPSLLCLKPYVMTAIYAEKDMKFMKSIRTPELAKQVFRSMGFHGKWSEEFAQSVFNNAYNRKWTGVLAYCLMIKPEFTKAISIMDEPEILAIFSKYGDHDIVHEYASKFAMKYRRRIFENTPKKPKRAT